MNTEQRPVFGVTTPVDAENLYKYGTHRVIVVPDIEAADFDLPGCTAYQRDLFNQIATRWKRAYCGNLLRVEGTHYDGKDWLLYDAGDHHITTDHVHGGEYDIDAITEMVINAPDDVKWLLQLVLSLVEPETKGG